MSKTDDGHHQGGWRGIVALSLGALGVVYGDIGTSPIYALKEIFFGREALVHDPQHVIGVVSTVVWAITLIVTIKYIVFVLRADHEDEGGVFALYARLKQLKVPYKAILLLLLIFAAGLLFGDGVITPAISVVSAVEGIGVATPSMTRFVIPITILILSGLFSIQKHGTSSIGKIFGPVMLVWFLVLGWLGLENIWQNPGILVALSPVYVIEFIRSVPWHELLIILGFVMLVVTGGEAMYADLGHFGRLPIRLSWLSVAYPALLLNYLGQGAYLLSGKVVSEGNIFYSMVPGWGLYPLIILSTIATIIASQALITGAYSLASQGVALDLLPAMPTKHTHRDHIGQIYIEMINLFLFVGCIALVLTFKSSSNLASAYGLAVSGVMFVTTITVGMIARYEWKWPTWVVAMVFVPFAVIDAVFMSANSLKFFEGGFVPLTIGIALTLVMISWRWGMNRLKSTTQFQSEYKVKELYKRRVTATAFVPKTMVIVTDQLVASMNDYLPPVNKEYLSKFELLPEHLLYLTIAKHHEPEMKHERFNFVPLDLDPASGTILSIQINYGFMEEVNLKRDLRIIKEMYPMAVHSEIDQWVFHVLHPKLFTTKSFHSLKRKIEYTMFKVMYKNSMTTEDFLGLNHDYHITAEVVPVKMR